MKTIMGPKVSIIMPVYNAARTLPDCLAAVGRMKYEPLELCIVNDCSGDNSLEIIETYRSELEHKMEVKLVTHSTNRGVAAARNTGLEQATGEYVCYIDADDWLEADALNVWVKEAVENDWDITGCEWFLSFAERERYMVQANFSTPQEAMENIMRGIMRWNLWLFLVKRDLYVKKGIHFEEGMNMGEDLMVMMKLLMNAQKVGLIKKGFYHYAEANVNSLTNSYSEEHIRQVAHNVEAVIRYAHETKWGDFVRKYGPYMKLNIKLPLIITDEKRRYQRWKSWWPETHPCIMGNKSLPLRTRLLQWCAAKGWWPVVWAYYKLVYKVVYGIIYK